MIGVERASSLRPLLWAAAAVAAGVVAAAVAVTPWSPWGAVEVPADVVPGGNADGNSEVFLYDLSGGVTTQITATAGGDSHTLDAFPGYEFGPHDADTSPNYSFLDPDIRSRRFPNPGRNGLGLGQIAGNPLFLRNLRIRNQ